MTAMNDILRNIRVGEPVVSGSTFMFPLFGVDQLDLEPLVLDHALATDTIEIDESSEDGSVPELAIRNKARRSVFLLDGEQVIGLKQNRTFNLSMMLPPQSSTIVPVSCLESGRWVRHAGRAKSAEHVHFKEGRANKMRSVSDSLLRDGSYWSDQGQVWRDVETKMAESRMSSRTSAEAEIYEQRSTELDSALSALHARPDQCGAIIGVGDKVVGIDLFGSTRLYHALSMKLLKSYLLDAVDRSAKAVPPTCQKAKEELAALLIQPESRFPSPGIGESHRWSSKAGAGAALIVDGHCIHAMAFRG